MTDRQNENPFDLIKASHFSDAEILDHWVDISEEHGGLLNVIKPRLIMPMLLLGGKGSGKTHLMRYCSSPVQAARHGNDLYKAVEVEKYLGIYVPVEGLNTDKFSGKGQDELAWLSVFSMYFELWLTIALMTTFRDLLRSMGYYEFSHEEFSTRTSGLFDTNVLGKFSDHETFIDFLESVRKSIDYSVNNAALTKKLDGITILFSPGRLIFGLPKIIGKIVPELSEVIFLYLIDEAENFTPMQQRFVNSLIRYRSGNTSIKVGARLYGIHTYETLGSGEPIKRDAEYERVELDSFLRSHEGEYKKLCSRLVIKRLSRLPGRPVRLDDSAVYDFFEELDASDYYKIPTLKLVSSTDKDGKERKYFAKLRKDLEKYYKIPEAEIGNIITPLSLPDYPLLEKLNCFLFYRKWPKDSRRLQQLADQIGADSQHLIERGRSGAITYAQTLEHFGSDLLAQLYRDWGQRVPYAGFNTLVRLSQGIPRNLLIILKAIYRVSLFAGERPFSGDAISVTSQSAAMAESASWFWEDAQPISRAVEVRASIEALAVLFRMVRYSERPAECDLCTFSVAFEDLSDASRSVIEAAENWSYLIRIAAGSKNKNSKRIDGKFQLGPMLAPKWGISEARRGSIEIQPDLANALFDHSRRSQLRALLEKRVAGMTVPKHAANGPDGQEDLPI